MSTQIDRPTYNECRKIITRVFKKLRHKRFGFWAYQNFSSDDWCGWMRLRHGGPNYTPVLGPNGQPMYNEAGERTQPCVWYHAQDRKRLIKESIVDLSWGGDYRHGRTVRHLFQEEGVSVEWDGSEEDKITLYFGAKKDQKAFFKTLCSTLDVDGIKEHGDAFVEFLRTTNRIGGLINLDGVECIARAAALRRTYESGAMKLIEIYDLVMSKLLAGGYRVIFGDEFMQGRLSEHRVFVDVFMQEALSCGVNGFLYHIETTENYWPVIQDAILSGDVHVHQNSMHWVLCRDSTLLMPIYHEWRDSGLYDDEDGVMFIDLFIKYGSKRRSELVQKIGSILDENTSVLKENDYRVCMDALKDLM